MSLKGPLDVHIAPMGYETERVYAPAVENDADFVILLIHENQTEKGADCQATVEAELNAKGIECEDKSCDFFDLYSSLWAIAELADEYAEHRILVNLATGSKITAISGMIVCMATKARPYYVKAKGYHGETISKGVKETVPLSVYPIGLPDKQYLAVLAFVDEEGDVAKGELVEYVRGEDFPLLSRYDRQELKNLYDPVDKEIIEPLQERGLIEEQRRGQEKRIWLTEDGKKTLKVFSYMLE
ncbi:HFX_2341 family transcriptional regulator domain-containing protein [Salinigranum salinum]|uniref:HFX_2341 family transcriptional regulator domain-containing protein n=1 Tax=Salinigranum salinum TaxID=1364937 RepID=UPI001260F415|nr:DUF6293 family protein [Salinigranum salinum]